MWQKGEEPRHEPGSARVIVATYCIKTKKIRKTSTVNGLNLNNTISNNSNIGNENIKVSYLRTHVVESTQVCHNFHPILPRCSKVRVFDHNQYE